MQRKKTEYSIEFLNVNKWYDDYHALRDINLNIKKQEKIVIVGPSGSGKSTLIRCINKLEEFQEGEIFVEGISVRGGGKRLEKIRRNVGMVFQSFNLFPHLTVLENCILAPMWVKKISKKEALKVAYLYLERVRVEDQADKYPAKLSGGQQQRVAIARALCMKPRIMLFDEPTSALDPEMVKEVLDTIKALTDDGMTMICVTHEMEFARQMADRMVFMDQGQIIEINDPENFFNNPQHERTRSFLGQLLSSF